LKLKVKDFIKEGTVIHLGYEPLRIDLITSINGCSFKKVWKNKKMGEYGSENVYFIGLNELLLTKRISNRLQDKIDIELLENLK